MRGEKGPTAVKPQGGPGLVRNGGSLSSPSCLWVSLCDPHSSVIHIAQLPALGQEILPSSAPHLAATEQIQIGFGLDSRKSRELCHPLREGSLSSSRPLLPFDKSESRHGARGLGPVGPGLLSEAASRVPFPEKLGPQDVPGTRFRTSVLPEVGQQQQVAGRGRGGSKAWGGTFFSRTRRLGFLPSA